MTRTIRQFIPLAALLAFALLVPAQAAFASASDQAISDCGDDEVLNGNYSNGELQRAINNLPGDLREYSDCEAVLGAAIGGPEGRAAGKGGVKGVGADGKPLTPAEKKVLAVRVAKQRQERKRLQAELGDARASLDPNNPDVLSASETDNGVPLPVLLSLIALACLAIGGGVMVAQRRSPAFANALRRVSPRRPNS